MSYIIYAIQLLFIGGTLPYYVQNKVTALCKEKWDWLVLHPDALGKDITDQQDDFDNRITPYMNKLQA